MTKFKFFWDQHILYYLMSTEEHFNYMVRKWGDRWYDHMEEKFWSGQWICGMLFGKSIFHKKKKKLP
jgi:hypothetical protein